MWDVLKISKYSSDLANDFIQKKEGRKFTFFYENVILSSRALAQFIGRCRWQFMPDRQ